MKTIFRLLGFGIYRILDDELLETNNVYNVKTASIHRVKIKWWHGMEDFVYFHSGAWRYENSQYFEGIFTDKLSIRLDIMNIRKKGDFWIDQDNKVKEIMQVDVNFE